MSEQVTPQPTLVNRSWWRNRWVLGLGAVIVVIIIVAASSGSSSANGWTAAAKTQTLQECGESGGSTQACNCAIRWFEGHLSPSQLVSAAQDGQYVQEGEALLAACPGVRGSGMLGN